MKITGIIDAAAGLTATRAFLDPAKAASGLNNLFTIRLTAGIYDKLKK